HLSAFAPRARALTAEIADGWMNFVTVLPAALHEVEEMAAASRAAGRTPASLYKTGYTLGCVLREGEDAASPRARAQAGPLVPVMFHAFLERTIDPERLGSELGEAVKAFRAQYEAYTPPDARYLQLHKGHLMWVRPVEERFVTPELIRMATFNATAAELCVGIHDLAAAGYQQLAV